MAQMRFRTRLVLSFVVLTLVTVAVVFFLTIRIAGDRLTNQIRSKVLTLAVTAANEVDGDLHEQILKAGDEETEAYKELEALLRKFRDANRRKDIHVSFIYTMRRVTTNPDSWIYVVDAEEPGEDKSPVGEIVEWEAMDEGDEDLVLGEAYAEKDFTIDPYGHWLSANAPIRNAAGEIVAMLGVDIRANDVIAARRTLLFSGLIALGISLVLGTGVAIGLNKWITRPLDSITEGVKRMGAGNLDTRLPYEGDDEFSGVRNALNNMAQAFQDRDVGDGSLTSYVSKDVAERLEAENRQQLLEGSSRRISLLRARIRHAHALASKLTPKEYVKCLNDFTNSFAEIAQRYGGVIESANGNSASAVFGALEDDPDHEKNAVSAVLEILEQQEQINQKRKLDGDKRLEIVAGVHTGNAVLGGIGSSQIVTAGGTSETTAAIEATAEKKRTNCLISEETHTAVRNLFAFEEVGVVSDLKVYNVAPATDVAV